MDEWQFHRQLAEYAEYHRDQRNCLMHIIGNPILFVAAVLPLSLLSVTVFGVQTSAAALLVIPALILWISWDIGLNRRCGYSIAGNRHNHC